MTRLGALSQEMRGMLGEGAAAVKTAAPATGPSALGLAMAGLSESLASAQRELAGHHKRLAPMVSGARGDDVRAVLLIVKEAHGILGDLRKTVAEEFGLKA